MRRSGKVSASARAGPLPGTPRAAGKVDVGELAQDAQGDIDHVVAGAASVGQTELADTEIPGAAFEAQTEDVGQQCHAQEVFVGVAEIGGSSSGAP